MKKLLYTIFFVVYDFLVASVSLILSFFLCGYSVKYEWLNPFTFSFLVWPMVTVFALYLVKVYNILWRFSGINEVCRILFGVFASFVVTAVS